MTIDALIQIASQERLQAGHVEAALADLRVSSEALYDQVAASIARRYLRGELSYTTCDTAMNELFRYATSGGGPELSRLAWRVFEAFDQGEYDHAGEPAEEQGEVKTRKLLSGIAELSDA